MDDLTQFKLRWNFNLPSDYQRFAGQGLLDHRPEAGLYFSYFSWLSLQQMAVISWPSYKDPRLIPFAITPGGDHFCWCQASQLYVASCPRDSDFAEGYAPSFTGFVYRALLEEFAYTWLTDVLERTADEVCLLLRSYVRRVAHLMPSDWASTLEEYSSRPYRPVAESYQFITQQECEETISRDLKFPLLGTEFRQHFD